MSKRWVWLRSGVWTSEWREAVRNSLTLPEKMRPLLTGDENRIVVTEDEATAMYLWAEQLPGWDAHGDSGDYPLRTAPVV